jgi:tetratricopeptide (TPR) repeat protein
MKPLTAGTVVTFYSYKGGTGRSMALAHVGWLLAASGKRVLMIDWDLEAPGLHRYFAPFLADPELQRTEGLIDFLLNYCDAATTPSQDGSISDTTWMEDFADISRYTQSIKFPGFHPDACLHLVGAGRQDELYSQRIGSFDWDHFYENLAGGGFLNQTKDQALGRYTSPAGNHGNAWIGTPYDYVLIDSRTGLSDTSGICTAQLPDKLVCLYTYNYQSVLGVAGVARSASTFRDTEFAKSNPKKSGEDVASSCSRLKVFPTGSRVVIRDQPRLNHMRSLARAQFNDLVWHIPPADVNSYWEDVELPNSDDLAYNEILAVTESQTDPKGYLNAILRLLKRLTLEEGEHIPKELESKTAQGIWEAFNSPSIKPLLIDDDNRADDILVPSMGSTDAYLASLKRVMLRFVAVESGIPIDPPSFGQVATRQLTDEDRHTAWRLLQAGILLLGIDPNTEERVLRIADEPRTRTSSLLIGWMREAETFLRWRARLQTISLGDRQSLEQVALEVLDDYPKTSQSGQGLADLPPRELAVWRTVVDYLDQRKKADEASERIDRAEQQVANANKKRVASVTYLTVGLILSLFVLAGSFWSVLKQVNSTEQAVKSLSEADLRVRKEETKAKNFETKLAVETKLLEKASEQRDAYSDALKLTYGQDKLIFEAAREATKKGDARIAQALYSLVDLKGRAQSSEQPIKNGNEFLKDRKYLEAEKAFHRALQLDPFSVEALFGFGEASLGQKKSKDDLVEAKDAIRKSYAFARSSYPNRVTAGKLIHRQDLGGDDLKKFGRAENVRIMISPNASGDSESYAKTIAWEIAKLLYEQGFLVESIQSPVSNAPFGRGIMLKSYAADDLHKDERSVINSIIESYCSTRIGLEYSLGAGLNKEVAHEIWISAASIEVFRAYMTTFPSKSSSR